MRKNRKFVHVGDSPPKIDKNNHADFFLSYQKAIINALVKRNLLTLSQYEQCVEEFERQQNKV